ncbi:conserved hypothetical protein [Histoplasma capsulatum H143]|uniref:Uncharacterized protein n=1 Tax=Ajellomyces capsulatus (strain H143) TaxID=544712 RepID=C6H5V1_AJECH|nr:conserved hypothetical protein [Histoplasma capsulatum H143]
MAFKDELLPTTSCEEILGPTEGLIDRTLPKGQRLYKFITKAAQNITKHVFAQRLSLIYSVHEIDKKFRAVNYACGSRLKTEAYKQVSKEWHCSLEDVKLWKRRGKCYTKLMQEAGPAIIFELDKDVSSFLANLARCEHSLRDEQRKLFTQWLLLQNFKQDRTAKCRLAAKIILQGLVAYGDYKYSSLRGAQSGLLSILRDYLSWGDDGTILPSNVPKDHISTNDPAHQMFVDHPGTSTQVESRRSTVDAATNSTSSTSSISDLASARHIEPNQNEIVDPPVPTTVELPADQRRNLLEDTTQNAVDQSFPASLQLVTTTSTTETYMPYTDYWATQPDYIATSPAETYMPCTDYWVAQSSGLDTESHLIDTQSLTTTASQPQLNMVNIRGYGGVYSQGHNDGSLQSHHTSSFRSEACSSYSKAHLCESEATVLEVALIASLTEASSQLGRGRYVIESLVCGMVPTRVVTWVNAVSVSKFGNDQY